MMPQWLSEAIMSIVRSGGSDVYLCVGKPPAMRLRRKVVELPGNVLTTECLDDAMEALFEGKNWRNTTDVDAALSFPGCGRFRLHGFKQRGSWSVVARLVPTDPPSHEDLGIPASVVQLMERPQGLVLVTGSTGSGKSTTVAALLRYVNEHFNKHIVTIEDPIEYMHAHNKAMIQQREVGSDVPSFGRGLHAALREAADIILVGELRDPESMRTALHAAETGHLVVTTMHTASAAETIDRLMDAFPAEEQPLIQSLAASTLLAVVSQALVPTKQEGMTAVFEVLLGTSSAKAYIRKGQTAQLNGVIQGGAREGMVTFEQNLAQKVKMGVVDRETALRVARRPDDFLANERSTTFMRG